MKNMFAASFKTHKNLNRKSVDNCSFVNFIIQKFFLKKPAIFYHLFSVFSNQRYNNIWENISIQYPVPGLELTTSWT